MFRAWLGVEIRTVVLKSRMITICLATLVARDAGITEAPICSAPWWKPNPSAKRL